MIPHVKTNALAVISLVLAGLGYALYGPLTRLVGTDFGASSQTLVRAIFRLVIVFSIMLFQSQKIELNIKSEDRRTIWLLGFLAAICTLTYIPAITHLPMGTTMFIFYAFGTMASYLVGHFAYKEKLDRSKIIAFICAIFGVGVMFMDKLGWGKITYLLIAVISGVSYGLYSSLSKKVSKKYSLTLIMLAVLVAEFTIYLPTWLYTQDAMSTNLWPWIANFIYAIDVVGVMYFVFYGFRHLEAQIASLLLLSELVFILLIGAIFYSEIPSMWQLFGGGLIILGLTIPNLKFIKN